MVQKMGLSQVIEDADVGALFVNGKVCAKGFCSFCAKKGCRVNSCGEREKRKLNSMEYVLTKENVMVEKLLRKRLIAPVHHGTSKNYATGKLLSTLHKKDMAKNFIILDRKLIRGEVEGRIESIAFKVHFLGLNGQPCLIEGEKWMSGFLMNQLISHSDKKKNMFMTALLTNVRRGAMRRSLLMKAWKCLETFLLLTNFWKKE